MRIFSRTSGLQLASSVKYSGSGTWIPCCKGWIWHCLLPPGSMTTSLICCSLCALDSKFLPAVEIGFCTLKHKHQGQLWLPGTPRTEFPTALPQVNVYCNEILFSLCFFKKKKICYLWLTGWVSIAAHRLCVTAYGLPLVGEHRLLIAALFLWSTGSGARRLQ